MKYVLGIDEAGRGSAAGSLVVGAAVVREDKEDLLKKLGVQDSKAFKHKKYPYETRARLYNQLTDNIFTDYIVATPKMIDEYVSNNKLDELERERAKKLFIHAVNVFPLTHVVFDSKNMFQLLVDELQLKYPKIQFEAMDKADSKVIAVSAASIVAKHQRDTLTKQIMGNYFENGKGYCNPGSEAWVRSWYDPELNDYDYVDMEPPINHIRKSFKWWTKLEQKLKEEYAKEKK